MEPSLGQMGPLPGTKWDPSLGQTGLSLFNSTVKSPFCPVCPWDGWGFVPGTIVPQGPSEKCLCVFSGWPRFGSVRLRFGDGTVRAVPVFGSGGSSKEGVFLFFSTISQRGRFRFRFRFLENGSGGSGSAFGSWENGSDGSGFRFRFGSWATLFSVYWFFFASHDMKSIVAGPPIY